MLNTLRNPIWKHLDRVALLVGLVVFGLLALNAAEALKKSDEVSADPSVYQVQGKAKIDNGPLYEINLGQRHETGYFKRPDYNGTPIRFEAFRGKWIVMAIYSSKFGDFQASREFGSETMRVYKDVSRYADMELWQVRLDRIVMAEGIADPCGHETCRDRFVWAGKEKGGPYGMYFLPQYTWLVKTLDSVIGRPAFSINPKLSLPNTLYLVVDDKGLVHWIRNNDSFPNSWFVRNALHQLRAKAGLPYAKPAVSLKPII